MVEFRSVIKSFQRGVHAVHALSFCVAKGETVALLGPSGCGKTTALRLINRLTEPTSGEVLVRGESVALQPAETLRRSIGYVIQESGLFPHWSVAQNIATVPRLLGWPRARVEQRVGELLELVGLPAAAYARRNPAELSGGERQRVGVARALAGDPDLLLMDEPFGAVDPITREALHVEFLDLQSRLGKTVVLVTHDMFEAGRLADRIVLMERGQIVQSGRTADLLLRPCGEFVRTFFGQHRRQMVFELLRLDDLLDGLSPLASAAVSGKSPGQDPPTFASVEVDGGTIVGDVLETLVGAPQGARLVPCRGRHVGQKFALSAVRRRIFHDGDA